MSENKNIDAIILAAGLSSRMGIPKALLDFNGFNFLINITLKLSSICGRIVVVTGHQSELVERTYFDEIKSKINEINFAFDISETVLEKIISRISFIKNCEYEKGMFTSLQAGIHSLENSKFILYHFVDQPAIPKYFYKKFAEEVNESTEWLQPVFDGKRGHPIIFSNHVAKKILQNSFDSNLRDIKKIISNKKYWECEYPEILDDINTKSEYNKITKQK